MKITAHQIVSKLLLVGVICSFCAVIGLGYEAAKSTQEFNQYVKNNHALFVKNFPDPIGQLTWDLARLGIASVVIKPTPEISPICKNGTEFSLEFHGDLPDKSREDGVACFFPETITISIINRP